MSGSEPERVPPLRTGLSAVAHLLPQHGEGCDAKGRRLWQRAGAASRERTGLQRSLAGPQNDNRKRRALGKTSPVEYESSSVRESSLRVWPLPPSSSV